jgi:16S rRNA (guanine527-N7)-methyltransferase
VTNVWLYRALEESRARGFLGPGAIETQIEHALGFSSVWNEFSDSPPARFLDLGSGGGLPGLVLFEQWRCSATFVDSMEKRSKFLLEVLKWDGSPVNGIVALGRAEQLARSPELEGQFPLVTARSFGPPAVTAECAVRFLSLDGVLLVSEPPDDHEVGRWNESVLAELGLHSEGRRRHGAAFQVLRKIRPTPQRFPREVGVPGKSPLF